MKIIWTAIAKKSYYKNIDYLEQYWTNEIVKEFILEVERTMKLLSDNPSCFQNWDFNASFRKGFVHKNVSFYYKIYDGEIVVFLFWNNYQNPEKLKSELLNF